MASVVTSGVGVPCLSIKRSKVSFGSALVRRALSRAEKRTEVDKDSLNRLAGVDVDDSDVHVLLIKYGSAS